MKNKRKFIIIIIIAFVLIDILLYFIFKNNSDLETSDNLLEYTPEEEISDEQMRETLVTLYFIDSETSELKSETQLINATLLIENPYKQLVELLIEGPKSSTLKSVLPENTRLLNSFIEENCVTLDSSEELCSFENEDQKYNIINSILNTLTQLNEVKSIKILINGQENEIFNDQYFEI